MKAARLGRLSHALALVLLAVAAFALGLATTIYEDGSVAVRASFCIPSAPCDDDGYPLVLTR